MIPFLDMKSVYAELKSELDAAYARVMESGWYVLGKEVEAENILKEAFDIDPFNVRVSNTLKVLDVLAACPRVPVRLPALPPSQPDGEAPRTSSPRAPYRRRRTSSRWRSPRPVAPKFPSANS